MYVIPFFLSLINKTNKKIRLQNCWQKDPAHRPEISEVVQLLEDNSCMITPSLDPPAASVQMEGSLEPVAPQKLKAHRDKAFQQQTKGEDKTICTVRPEETVPHQAAALFGMEHVARNQVGESTVVKT